MNSKRTLEGAVVLLLLFCFLPITINDVSFFQEKPISTGIARKLAGIPRCSLDHAPMERPQWRWVGPNR